MPVFCVACGHDFFSELRNANTTVNQSDPASLCQSDCKVRLPYHAPALHEYGEIVQLTGGVAGTGADGVGYASVDLGA